MVETSLFWEGLITGDASLAPYDNDEYSDILRKSFQRDRAADGVIRGYANELEVESTGGTNMRVPTGAAWVDGKFYETDANVDNASAGNTVYWLIGLTKSWAAQTIRVFARGTYATRALALAALVQNDGVTWEIPLATVLTDAAGDVDTITDERTFLIPYVELIEQQTLAVAGTFDFLTIPQIYSHLKLVANLRSTASGGGLATDSMEITFNGDGGANYDEASSRYDVVGGGHLDSNAAAQTSMTIGTAAADDQDAGTFSPNELLIPDYTASILHMITCESMHYGAGGVGSVIYKHSFGRHKVLAAITRITITAAVAPNTFEAGSVVSLYGLPR